MIYRRRIATPIGYGRFGFNRSLLGGSLYNPYLGLAYWNQYPIRSSNLRNPIFSSPYCRCTCSSTRGCNCNCWPWGSFPIARPYNG